MKPTFLLLAILFSISLSAQRTEIGLLRGVATYSGEIRSSNSLPIGDVKSSFGMFWRQYIHQQFAVRAGFYLSSLAADNSKIVSNPAEQLQFSTSLFEGQILGEYHFPASPDSRLSTFLFGGLAVFHFNPETTYIATGEKLEDPTDLRQWQVAIPVGMGMKWNLAPRFSLGWELGLRKTFTDSLDNVASQTSDGTLSAIGQRTKGQDWYAIGGLTATYRIF